MRKYRKDCTSACRLLDNIRNHDLIAPRCMVNRLRLSTSRLAQLAHVNRNTMTSKPDSSAFKTSSGEIARVIYHVADLAGDQGRAIIWFKHQPIPVSAKNPEELVEAGQANLVREDLDRMVAGIYS